MTTNDGIDLTQVARELGIPLSSIQRTVELFDDSNTVAFIARFRKDQTGGLNEEQVRQIGQLVQRLRSLTDRKKSIVKSLETQGKLTPELAESIRSAPNQKTLEDIYLPLRPKKQTLSTQAKRNGLEPLALEIVNATTTGADLHQLATELGAQRSPPIAGEDVLAGVRHILAERFSENSDLHERLWRVVERSGRLLSTKGPLAQEKNAPDSQQGPKTERSSSSTASAEITASETPEDSAQRETHGQDISPIHPAQSTETGPVGDVVTDAVGQQESGPAENPDNGIAPSSSALPPESSTLPLENSTLPLESSTLALDRSTGSAVQISDQAPVESLADQTQSVQLSAAPTPEPPTETSGNRTATPGVADASVLARSRTAERKSKQREKKRKLMLAAFKDYFSFNELISKVPPHRVLALNRGERAKILRVRIDVDNSELEKLAEEKLVPPEHPYADFLRSCLRDSLNRLIIPGLEREARRELTEKAESRALEVFVRNLRALLLQPPIRGRRILAIDPGFRSGCKIVALDEFGNVLGHGVLHIVGKDEWQSLGRAQLVQLVKQHNVSVIAIGNGAGCRATEQLVANCIAKELQPSDIAYVIVNEAGTNEYSTSAIGREELPDFDPTLRSAISIGRRLLDPLSELVKINPANIGVGLYQHDMKAKHLRESLDALVESCVNFVGVDVNTASPALLQYVSGLNQLTARRIHDYRREHGPFVNREQLKQVPGIGEATYVQSAGFLRIQGGENPLDSTWIHPESYGIASRVLASIDCDVNDLRVGGPLSTSAPESTTTDQHLVIVTDDAQAASTQHPSLLPTATTVVPADGTTEIASTEVLAIVSSTGELAPGETGVSEPGISELAKPEPTSSEPASSEPASSEPANPVSENEPTLALEQPAATEQMATAGTGSSEGSGLRKLAQHISQVDVEKLSAELGIGTLSLKDIMSALSQPGRDPREDLSPPIFRRGIMKLEDLQTGMELSGTVLNVVDFGAFVDVGISDSGLVHISCLADRFVKDPHDVVVVGDVLRVWVLEVDKARRRVSLTAIRPGTERQHHRRQPVERSSRPQRPGGGRLPAKPPAHASTEGASSTAGSAAGEARVEALGDARAASRPEQGSAPPRQRESHQRRGKGPRPPKFEVRRQEPKKPKPIVPITKEMEEGRAPLRSFSDLAQYYEKKRKPEP